MKQRKLGSQGLTVSALGPGCMGMNTACSPFVNEELVGQIART